jgi:hypothetical protein
VQVPVVHTRPAQHAWPAPPHASQRLFPLHTFGAPHQFLSAPGQQRSPAPPHGVHRPFWQSANGAVQPTPAPQHASPSLPHEPPPQPPLEHCVLFEQLVPLATQVGKLRFPPESQQPPAPHTLPSQHGCPGPPQVWHCVVSGLHARPDAVQKRAASAPPMQQFWFRPPQGAAPLAQLDVAAVHVPS